MSAADTGLDVQNVLVEPPGPTKVNGPVGLLLAAAWNCNVVFATVEPVQERLQRAVFPAEGLASLSEEISVPDATVGITKVWKSSSKVWAVHAPPLFVVRFDTPLA